MLSSGQNYHLCSPPSGRINNYAQVQLFLKKTPRSICCALPEILKFLQSVKRGPFAIAPIAPVVRKKSGMRMVILLL
jgi:hypothetical protein